MKGLRLAVGFLTVFPLPPLQEELQPGDLGRSAAWFPLVGLVIGALLTLALSGLPLILPASVSAVIVVALWALMTGGLHLDGLADCGDGLLAAVSRERRLEIMRDPRLGSFGGMTLVLHLLLKVSLLAALAAHPLKALLIAPVLARWLILIVARQPNVRPGGLGAEFALGLSRKSYLYAAILPILAVLYGGVRGVLAALLAHLVMFAVIRLAKSRLGGVTGDVLGLTVELGEVAALLAFVVWLPFGL